MMTSLDTIRSVNSAIMNSLRASSKIYASGNTVYFDDVEGVREVRMLAHGEYNSVWVVRLHDSFEIPHEERSGVETSHTVPSRFDEYVLRLPCHDAFLPYQVANEVAFRKCVGVRLPHIPVPRIFFYHATSEFQDSFIAEEYIHGTPLSSSWMSFSPSQKLGIARQLAVMTVDLAGIQFDMIGGFYPETPRQGPVVEGAKPFKGHEKFHNRDSYNIGPFKSTKEYILACYDREILFYSHASESTIDNNLFTRVSVQQFIVQLQKKRDDLERTYNIPDEPFVLVHGDFHGRNILMGGDHILALINWELAGSYPLSETLAGEDIEVVKGISQALDEENTLWGRNIREEIRREVVQRGWEPERIASLLGEGNDELGRARTEMFP